MVRAVLPTPPSPSTTSLYKVIFPAMVTVCCSVAVRSGVSVPGGQEAVKRKQGRVRGVVEDLSHVVAEVVSCEGSCR